MKNFKLPKNIAEPWLKALRSGEYEQGQEYLFRNNIPAEDNYLPDIEKNCYCCLGVLAKINNCKITPFGQAHLADLDDIDFLEQLPQDIVEDNGELAKILIRMNDSQNKSFNEIADWIENNVEFI